LKKFAAFVLSFTLLFAMVLPASAASLRDTSNHWGKQYIEQLVDQNVVAGFSDGTFKPDNTITVAEFLTLLIKAKYAVNVNDKMTYNNVSESYVDNHSRVQYFNSDNLGLQIPDVTTSDWYYKYIAAAVSDGIVANTKENILPNKNITREEMAIYVNRMLGVGMDMRKQFNDISGTYAEHINKVAVMKVINGKGAGVFDPKGNATRAEAATIIVRSLKALPYMTSYKSNIKLSAIAAQRIKDNFKDGKKLGDESAMNSLDSVITLAELAEDPKKKVDPSSVLDIYSILENVGNNIANLTIVILKAKEISKDTTEMETRLNASIDAYNNAMHAND
jgi:hypothetical protein